MRKEKKDEKKKYFFYKKTGILFGVIIFIILASLIYLASKVIVDYYHNDESTIELFGKKIYLVDDDIDELNIKKDSLIIGDKDRKSSIQIFGIDKHEAEIIDNAHDYRNFDNYECDANSFVRILGSQIELLSKFYWVIFVIFVIYNIVYFILYKESIKDVFLILRRIQILALLILIFIILSNIGYIKNYSHSMTVNIKENQNGDYFDIDNVFIVTDDDLTWGQETSLNIFDNKFYGTNKIAPGVYGAYKFDVRNLSDYRIRYSINFSEDNDYKINLMYRLSKNGEYLNENYQDVTNLENVIINSNDIDEYVLEWKWVDNYNDTEIGENAENVIYILNIEINASYDV